MQRQYMKNAANAQCKSSFSSLAILNNGKKASAEVRVEKERIKKGDGREGMNVE